MNSVLRVLIYALATAVVEGILIWGLFTYADARYPTIWLILAENFGLIVFPLYQGPILFGFFALLIGIACWFFFVCLVGEVLYRMRTEKRQVSSAS